MEVKRKPGLYYFAHPYTAKDNKGCYVPAAEEANFRLCCYRSSRLLLAGYNIYSPISHTHPIHCACPEFLQRHEHKLWYELDIAFIEHAGFTGVILAPGWGTSKGCKLEYEWFLSHKQSNGEPHEILLYKDIVGD
jgi:hypothetical protein